MPPAILRYFFWGQKTLRTSGQEGIILITSTSWGFGKKIKKGELICKREI